MQDHSSLSSLSNRYLFGNNPNTSVSIYRSRPCGRNRRRQSPPKRRRALADSLMVRCGEAHGNDPVQEAGYQTGPDVVARLGNAPRRFCSNLRIDRRSESVTTVPWPDDAPDWLVAANEKEHARIAWSWWEPRLGDFDLRPRFAEGDRLIAIDGYVGEECRASGFREPGEDLNALLHNVASDASMPDAYRPNAARRPSGRRGAGRSYCLCR
jgi:hypothetical protein